MAIISFSCKATQELYETGKSKRFNNIFSQAARRLEMLDAADGEEDLRVPPGNGFEALKGNLKGWYSLRVNKQWRVLFRFREGNAYDVRIEDYH